MGDLSQAEVWIEGGGMLGFGDSWTLDGIEVVHEDSRRAWEFRPEQKRRVIRKGRDRSVIIKAAPLSADRLAGEPAAAPEADPGGQEGAKGGEEGPSSQGGNRGIEAVPRSEGEASDAPDGWGDGDDEYMVVVRTGDMDNAGTDAEVAIEIINEGLTLGFSPELRQGMESFERGAEDTFYTVSHQGDIGPLMCIRVYMLVRKECRAHASGCWRWGWRAFALLAESWGRLFQHDDPTHALLAEPWRQLVSGRCDDRARSDGAEVPLRLPAVDHQRAAGRV